jgi:hypothetical protein
MDNIALKLSHGIAIDRIEGTNTQHLRRGVGIPESNLEKTCQGGAAYYAEHNYAHGGIA